MTWGDAARGDPDIDMRQFERTCTGGSDPRRFRRCILPPDALVVALPTERRRVGRSCRDTYHEPRRRKLSPEQAAAIRGSSGNRTPRELAAEFGVSHETIRAVLRGHGSALVP